MPFFLMAGQMSCFSCAAAGGVGTGCGRRADLRFCLADNSMQYNKLSYMPTLDINVGISGNSSGRLFFPRRRLHRSSEGLCRRFFSPFSVA